MNPFRIDQVTAEDVNGIVSAKVRETRHLDYKRELPRSDADAKKEFLADVTSFANSGGGAIVFGVAEVAGVPEVIVGLHDVNLDKEILRMEQWLRSQVEPRLPAHRIHVVETSAGVNVVVLVVSRSWLGPHMVATGDSRFYGRSSNGKYALGVTEIRAAFLDGDEIPSKIHRFRHERLGQIVSANTPVGLPEGARVVLHIVPFGSLGRGAGSANVQAWAESSPPALDGTLIGTHFNADGHVGYAGKPENGHRGYVQLFRSGAVESVGVENRAVDGVYVMNIWHTETEIVDGLRAYLDAMIRVGVEPPVSVAVSLVGVRGYSLLPSPSRRAGGKPIIDRDIVVLPDVVVDEFDSDLPSALRPVFDALWQTFGMPRSLCYADNGEWNRNFRW